MKCCHLFKTALKSFYCGEAHMLHKLWEVLCTTVVLCLGAECCKLTESRDAKQPGITAHQLKKGEWHFVQIKKLLCTHASFSNKHYYLLKSLLLSIAINVLISNNHQLLILSQQAQKNHFSTSCWFPENRLYDPTGYYDLQCFENGLSHWSKLRRRFKQKTIFLAVISGITFLFIQKCVFK